MIDPVRSRPLRSSSSVSRAARIATALALVAATEVAAAEFTRVASSFETDKPFGMFLDVAFDRTQTRGKITREWYQDGKITDVTELRYTGIDTRMNIDAHLGLYRDLEFYFQLPIVFAQDRSWGYAFGTTDQNSTLGRNCIDAAGNALPAPSNPSNPGPNTCTPGNGTGRVFAGGDGSKSFRGGLGDLSFGLAYAIFNEKRDDTKPTWVMRFTYTAPSASVLDPSAPTSETARGAIGERVHRYTFATQLSKRVGYADPYFGLHYTLPWVGPGAYSNCSKPSASNQGAPENCNQGAWSLTETGIRPAHTGGFVFGAELVPFERVDAHQKIAFDFRGWLTYVSEGRYYNELSDLNGKLNYTSDYAQLGAHLGLVAHAAEFFRLTAYASLAYNTEHFLTNEGVGLDGSGKPGIIDQPVERNPNYDWRMDRTSRRFRIEETTVFRILVQGTFSF